MDRRKAKQRARVILKWDRENGYSTTFSEKRALLRMCGSADCIYWLNLLHWLLPDEQGPNLQWRPL